MLSHTNTNLLCSRHAVLSEKKACRVMVWLANQQYQEAEIPVWKTCRTFLSSEAANSNNLVVSSVTPLKHAKTHAHTWTHTWGKTKAGAPTSLTSHNPTWVNARCCYSLHSPPRFLTPCPITGAILPLFPAFYVPLCLVFFHHFLPSYTLAFSPFIHPILCIQCQVNWWH